MDEKEKLFAVMHHWIEHNESHMRGYGNWAKKAGELELDNVKAAIEDAVEKLNQCNLVLKKALKKYSS